jgi:hypothetical protein
MNMYLRDFINFQDVVYDYPRELKLMQFVCTIEHMVLQTLIHIDLKI